MYPDDTVPDPTLVDFVTFAESGPVTRGRAVRGRGRTPRRGRGRGRAVERVLCPSCGRGFQRNKVPPNVCNQIQRPGPGPGSKKAKELDIEVNRNLSIF